MRLQYGLHVMYSSRKRWKYSKPRIIHDQAIANKGIIEQEGIINFVRFYQNCFPQDVLADFMQQLEIHSEALEGYECIFVISLFNFVRGQSFVIWSKV